MPSDQRSLSLFFVHQIGKRARGAAHGQSEGVIEGQWFTRSDDTSILLIPPGHCYGQESVSLNQVFSGHLQVM